MARSSNREDWVAIDWAHELVASISRAKILTAEDSQKLEDIATLAEALFEDAINASANKVYSSL